jgi:cell division protein FtsL
MAYVNGNLALQPKRKPEQKKAFRETKKVVVKRKSLPVQEKLLYMFTIIVCVIVAGVIIFRYAQIYEINNDIKNMTNKYAAMEVEMKELQKQVETLSNPERIEQQAEELGMGDFSEDTLKVKTGDKETATAMNKE